MEIKRRVRARMFVVLLVLWNISAAFSGLNLECTNDYEEHMCCHIEAENCIGYHLNLWENEYNKSTDCVFKQHVGQCYCSFNNMALVSGYSYTATVWKGDKKIESKTISVKDTIKPKTPTNVAVTESNGNFVVEWMTNYREKKSFSDRLMAYVTYGIKGGTPEEPKSVTPITRNGMNNYEILGRDLKSSTTYVVSVKSYLDSSKTFSDSSEEKEFTTPMSPVTLPLVVIICLSVAAVIITGVIYFCFVKLKTKWWDTMARCPNPKLLLMHSSEQEILKPVRPTISSVSIEPLVPDDNKPWSKGSLIISGSPQQSSGISTGSSCLSYANTEPADIIAGVQEALGIAFANISPVSPLSTNPLAKSNKDCALLSSSYNPCDVRADDMSSGSSCFDNKTYSILIPGCQIVTDSDEAQTQAEMLCESTYRPNAGDTEPCVDQQAPACPLVKFPPVVLSLMPTDMSYQHCNADSGGFPHAEDSSLSSVSSGTNSIASCDPVSRVEAGYESFDEAVRGATKLPEKTEENPCYGSRSFPPMEDDYQPLDNLVEQPAVLFSEERSDEKEEQLNKYPGESFTKTPQSFVSPADPSLMNSVQSGSCLSELQTPCISLMPADQSKPLFTDSGYQCV